MTYLVENFEIGVAAKCVHDAPTEERAQAIEQFVMFVYINLCDQAVKAARKAAIAADALNGAFIDGGVHKVYIKHALLGAQAFFDPEQGTRNAFTVLLEQLLQKQ
jgi:hypothetical protein